MGYSQRVIIILRPIIVRSNLDEVLLNVYRLNGFTIIKRTYKFLTKNETFLIA